MAPGLPNSLTVCQWSSSRIRYPRVAARPRLGSHGDRLGVIGTADDTIDADGTAILTYAQAQAMARQRFVERKRVAAGQLAAASGPYTVKDVISDYLALSVAGTRI